MAGEGSPMGTGYACWRGAERFTAAELEAARRGDVAYLMDRIDSLRTMVRGYWCDHVASLRER